MLTTLKINAVLLDPVKSLWVQYMYANILNHCFELSETNNKYTLYS